MIVMARGLIVFAVLLATASAAMAHSARSTAPNDTANVSAGAKSVSCTASAVYTIDGQQAFGTWTKTAKAKCRIRGTWADAPEKETWVIQRTGRGTLSGSLTISGLQPPGCASTWPLTGSISNKTHFDVTATDPGDGDSCVHTIEAAVTIQ